MTLLLSIVVSLGPAQDEIDAWVRKLGAASPEVREAATAALIKRGRDILPRLIKHQQATSDPEVRARIQAIRDEFARRDRYARGREIIKSIKDGEVLVSLMKKRRWTEVEPLLENRDYNETELIMEAAFLITNHDPVLVKHVLLHRPWDYPHAHVHLVIPLIDDFEAKVRENALELISSAYGKSLPATGPPLDKLSEIVLARIDDRERNVRYAALQAAAALVFRDRKLHALRLRAEQLVDDKNPYHRAGAFMVLNATLDPKYVGSAKAHLADKSPAVRWYALTILQNNNVRDAGADVVARLEDPHRPIREEACRTLLLAPPATFAPHFRFLNAYLHSDPDLKRRIHHVSDWGTQEEKDALGSGIGAMFRDHDSSNDPWALRWIETMHDPRQGAGLLPLLRNPASSERKDALRIVAEIRYSVSPDVLASCMKDPREDVRLETLETIRVLANPEMDQIVIRALDDENRKVRLKAFEVVASLQMTAARPTLRKKAHVNSRAAAVLSGMATSEDIGLLWPRAQKGDRSALSAVARLDPERALPLLRERMKKPDAEIRTHAINELVRLNDHDSLDAIRSSLGDTNHEVRGAALRAIASFHPEAGKAILHDAFHEDPHWKVRAAAAEAMSTDWPDAFVELAPRLLAKKEWRAWTLWKLGLIDSPGSLKILRELLEDPEARPSPIFASIARIDRAGSRGLFLEHLNGKDPQRRFWAAVELAALREPAACNVLLTEARWETAGRRFDALMALNALRRPDWPDRIHRTVADFFSSGDRVVPLLRDVESAFGVTIKVELPAPVFAYPLPSALQSSPVPVVEQRQLDSIGAGGGGGGRYGGRFGSRGLDPPEFLWAVLRRASAKAGPFAVIVEDRSFRIVAEKDAMEFWKQWVDEHMKER